MFRKTFSLVYGFTLIELMAVVSIMGILATIAIPSYQNSIRKGRRADAKAELTRLAQDQQKYRVTNTDFANDATLGTADSMYYTFAVASSSASAFNITATPKPTGGQEQDACTTLAIDQNALITSSTCHSP